MLTAMKDEHTELSGYTEVVIPDFDLWQKMINIHYPLVEAIADVDRVLGAVEIQIKKDEKKEEGEA